MKKQREALCLLNNALNYTAVVVDELDIWLRRTDRTIVTGEKRSPRRRTCPIAALFSSNPN
jgi:hypothetical protein